jgi:hypothetical protein
LERWKLQACVHERIDSRATEPVDAVKRFAL